MIEADDLMLSNHERRPDKGLPEPMTDSASSPSESHSLLQIQRVCTAGGMVLTLEGELDISTAAELERQLPFVDHAGIKTLLIDLERVEFMDSTGLALIVRAAQSAKTSGCQLRLRSGPRQVQRLFELTGLLDRFTFED